MDEAQCSWQAQQPYDILIWKGFKIDKTRNVSGFDIRSDNDLLTDDMRFKKTSN